MKLLERIFVPVDFGPRTEAVVAVSTSLAKTFNSEVELLHVLPEMETTSPEACDVLEMAREAAATRLTDIASRLRIAGVRQVAELVVEGEPFDHIIRRAHEFDANVIVVGSHGRTSGHRSQLGTTVERLCRRSTKPVWIVGAEGDVVPRRILCPVDGSPASRRALRNAIHLARRLEAKLLIMHVVHSLSAWAGLLATVQPSVEQSHLEKVVARWESFLSEFDFHGVDWEKVLRQDAPAEAILAAATEFRVDLIVMGRIGRTGLSRMLLGEVATSVMRNAACSVVFVSAEDAIRLRLDEDISNLQSHYARGCELLENGFLEEAKRQFEYCIRISGLFVPAWTALAAALERQGDAAGAEKMRATAKELEEMVAWQTVEADVRRSHPLWKKS